MNTYCEEHQENLFEAWPNQWICNSCYAQATMKVDTTKKWGQMGWKERETLIKEYGRLRLRMTHNETARAMGLDKTLRMHVSQHAAHAYKIFGEPEKNPRTYSYKAIFNRKLWKMLNDYQGENCGFNFLTGGCHGRK